MEVHSVLGSVLYIELKPMVHTQRQRGPSHIKSIEGTSDAVF